MTESVDRIRDVESLKSCLSQGEEIEFLFFWGHRPSKDGRISKSCLSQWFEAPFERGECRYGTAEHFMMEAKARLFGDDEIAEEILQAGSPAKAKKLGRKVCNYQEDTWRQRRFDVVVEGNLLKFGQNPEMATFLLGTGDAVLVEASPTDRIWGIGLARDDSRASNPQKWNGRNLLGFALMEVRSRLRQSEMLEAAAQK